jgi:hypothetical protein
MVIHAAKTGREIIRSKEVKKDRSREEFNKGKEIEERERINRENRGDEINGTKKRRNTS